MINLKSDVSDFQYMRELYMKNGIHIVESKPIPEFSKTDSLCEYLFDAAKLLQSVLKERYQRNVFIHCSAGMTRAPSVAILYLCLFCKVEFWQQP